MRVKRELEENANCFRNRAAQRRCARHAAKSQNPTDTCCHIKIRVISYFIEVFSTFVFVFCFNNIIVKYGNCDQRAARPPQFRCDAAQQLMLGCDSLSPTRNKATATPTHCASRCCRPDQLSRF